MGEEQTFLHLASASDCPELRGSLSFVMAKIGMGMAVSVSSNSRSQSLSLAMSALNWRRSSSKDFLSKTVRVCLLTTLLMRLLTSCLSRKRLLLSNSEN